MILSNQIIYQKFIVVPPHSIINIDDLHQLKTRGNSALKSKHAPALSGRKEKPQVGSEVGFKGVEPLSDSIGFEEQLEMGISGKSILRYE